MSIKCDNGTHCELNKGSMILLQKKKKKPAGPQAIITGLRVKYIELNALDKK